LPFSAHMIRLELITDCYGYHRMEEIDMIETAIFDLGDVFVKVDSDRSVRRLCQRFRRISEKALLKYITNSGLQHRFERGQIDGRTFYDELRKESGEDFSYDYFIEIWQEIFDPIHPMIDLLPDLKERFQLVLLSNTDELHIEYIREQYGFFHHFDHLIFSYEVGLLKPGVEIFRFAIQRSKSLPEECVFVDDLLENIQAAKGLGIKGIHFKGYDHFVQEWKKLVGNSLCQRKG